MDVMASFRLDGKVALITGSAGLYGRQMTRALAQAGARVFVASRKLEALQRQAAEFKAEGLEITALQLDQAVESSVLETRDKITAEEARRLIAAAPGAVVVDERKAGGYPTPVTHAAGQDPVFVGRIREDISHPRGLSLWVVADNIRKGAALNAVQIAELLVKNAG